MENFNVGESRGLMLLLVIASANATTLRKGTVKTIQVSGFCFNHVSLFSSFLLFSIKIHSSVGNRYSRISCIQVGNGEVVDCVDMYRQPAFDQLLSKGYKIRVLFSSS